MEKPLFQQFVPIADGIATLLKPYAEVIIHDLKTQEILHISNSFSKRDKGFPSHLEGVKISPGQDIIGPYEKINWDSRRLKSVSITLKDSTSIPVGLMCINLDISVADELKRVISAFTSPQDMVQQPEDLFQNDWHEKVNIYIHNWAQKHQKNTHDLTLVDKRTIVKTLYEQGAFNNPKSHEYVAGVLDLSRATIFKYLKQIKDTTPDI